MKLNFSEIAIFQFITWTIVIFLIFRVLEFGLNLMSNRINLLGKISAKIYPLEFIVWTVFITIEFKIFLEKNQYFALILFLSAISAAFFATKTFIYEYISGIKCKSQNILKLGYTIKINDFSGKIVNLKSFSFEIELSNGQTTEMPYSEAIKNSVVKISRQTDESIHSFTTEISQNKDLSEISNIIKQAVLTAPGAVTSQKPEVTILVEKNNNYIIEIKYRVIDKTSAYKIQKIIKNKI